MLEISGVCFAIALFGLGIALVLYDGAKKDLIHLRRVNDSLAGENCILADKNRYLVETLDSLAVVNELQRKEIHDMLEKMDVHEFPVGATVLLPLE